MTKHTKRNKDSIGMLSAIIAMAAASGMMPVPIKSDHSVRDSNRMKFTDEELSHLETLSGKEKKQYIKQLKLKYNVSN